MLYAIVFIVLLAVVIPIVLGVFYLPFCLTGLAVAAATVFYFRSKARKTISEAYESLSGNAKFIAVAAALRANEDKAYREKRFDSLGKMKPPEAADKGRKITIADLSAFSEYQSGLSETEWEREKAFEKKRLNKLSVSLSGASPQSIEFVYRRTFSDSAGVKRELLPNEKGKAFAAELGIDLFRMWLFYDENAAEVSCSPYADEAYDYLREVGRYGIPRRILRSLSPKSKK